ncbi:MurR/RpiR family transcriptional regulator [Vagococcus intermedius]|uniref:MurR/RpiR family transcriptional regulator n=1 Tax=Vagococcus intermedius TaxID=2991418 RepID=A0AAF0CT84_9ENTE|nr:MurR/RpiR family transcriptional regulator [Vagococcus intermedius]WEG72530.1 MurR/RpiR family transcriptional regulator [Vagococcus intermedius]WEG74618.1 MurR/RpiR family transcriptional regulator [Vagococcus intermedius]
MIVIFTIDELIKLSELDAEIAQYVIKNTEQVAYMRIRELAKATHVSPSSIVRFVKHIGFESYPEFRLHVRNHLEETKTIIDTTTYTQTFVTNNSLTPNFEQALSNLTTKIRQADLIHCIGMGASGAVAEYASKHLATLGYHSFVTKGTYFPYAMLDQHPVNNITELCLFFSVSGHTIELIQMAEKLKNQSNITTACITSKQTSNLAKQCDLTVPYDTSYDRIHYHADLSSQLPVIFIIETIIKNLISTQAKDN